MLTGDVPAYREIALQIRAALLRGEVKPGRNLPSVRALAIDLGVNHNTVAEAYRLLERTGWIDLRDRRGAVVVRTEAHEGKGVGRFSRRLAETLSDARHDGVGDDEIIEALRDAIAEIRIEEAR